MCFVERIPEAEVGKPMELPEVLLIGSPDFTLIGRPTVPGAKVVCAVEEQFREGKVVVFKKKRRKGYMRTKSHRRHVTTLRISAIEFDEKALASAVTANGGSLHSTILPSLAVSAASTATEPAKQ